MIQSRSVGIRVCLPAASLVAISLALPIVDGADQAADRGNPPVPLFEGLGTHTRPVSTVKPDAQRYFDQGLAFLYAFNHDEAVRSFRKTAEIDPQCGMAWWGMAIALGPHINNPAVSTENAAQAWQAVQRASELASRATPVEQALISAAARRYSETAPEDRKPLDVAYAQAMRGVRQKFPQDVDVGALLAEALMDLRPWDLWTVDARPQPGTEEIVALLEDVLKQSPNHPLALHLYVHAVEASSDPGRADGPADRLRDLQPGLGHLVHMPSHVDVRRGRWAEAIVANQKAIAADRKYRQQSPRQGFYRIYVAHNHHMLTYAALMRGQSQLALTTIRQMVDDFPAEWLKENASLADGFLAMPLEVQVRFGRWDDVLKAPEPAAEFPISRAMRHCARGIAFAAKGEPRQAREEQAAFLKAREAAPKEAVFGNNEARNLFTVAEHLLAGEILVREGNLEAGLAELRLAVAAEDQLRYDEPPDWIHPVRHALGATLLKHGRAAEAERVYREDLARLPENGWSLLGLTRSLKAQGKTTEAAEFDRRFQKVWRDADVKITSSCFCQPGQ